MKKISIISTILIMCYCLSKTVLIDRVVADLNGKPIMYSEVKHFMKVRGISKSLVEATRSYALEKAVLEELQKNGIEFTKREINNMKRQIYNSQFSNISYEEFEKVIDQRIGMQLYEQMLKLQRLPSKVVYGLLKKRVEVSDLDVKIALQNIKSQPEAYSYYLKQILVSDKKIAEKIYDKINNKNFEKLAKKHSKGPMAKNGGVVGFVAFEDLSKEFKDKLRLLSPNRVSPIIKTSNGYHILMYTKRKLLDKYVKNTKEARKDLEYKLIYDRINKIYFRWYNDFIKKVRIDIKSELK